MTYPDLLNIFSEALKMSGYDNVSSFTAVSFMLYAIIKFYFPWGNLLFTISCQWVFPGLILQDRL